MSIESVELGCSMRVLKVLTHRISALAGSPMSIGATLPSSSHLISLPASQTIPIPASMMYMLTGTSMDTELQAAR